MALRDTQQTAYTDRLLTQQTAGWKRLLDVQAPYRWNLHRLKLGFTLDIGCGIGRNLINLNGYGVGIDHNPESVTIARQRGLSAFTPEEFQHSGYNVPERFDSMLLAHVAEHMTQPEVATLIDQYLKSVKLGGRIILITPQEVGYRSDASHVEFMDFSKLSRIAQQLNLNFMREYSFPFPRWFGYFFIYNEFVSVSQKNSA